MLLLSHFVLRVRYCKLHIGGVGVCLIGVAVLVFTDYMLDRYPHDGQSPRPATPTMVPLPLRWSVTLPRYPHSGQSPHDMPALLPPRRSVTPCHARPTTPTIISHPMPCPPCYPHDGLSPRPATPTAVSHPMPCPPRYPHDGQSPHTMPTPLPPRRSVTPHHARPATPTTVSHPAPLPPRRSVTPHHACPATPTTVSHPAPLPPQWSVTPCHARPTPRTTPAIIISLTFQQFMLGWYKCIVKIQKMNGFCLHWVVEYSAIEWSIDVVLKHNVFSLLFFHKCLYLICL